MILQYCYIIVLVRDVVVFIRYDVYVYVHIYIYAHIYIYIYIYIERERDREREREDYLCKREIAVVTLKLFRNGISDAGAR